MKNVNPGLEALLTFLKVVDVVFNVLIAIVSLLTF